MRTPSLVVFAVLVFGFADAPAKSATDDTYVHPSGLFRFPVSIGSMVRTEVKAYDEKGDDVGVSYRDANSRLLISIYAYPPLKLEDGSVSSFEAQFGTEHAVILETSGTVQIAWPRSLPIWSDEGVPGMLQAYDLRGSGTTVSLLQLYDYKRWRLKFRSTYPASEAERAESLINDLHKAFAWPTAAQRQGALAGS